jgi:hypothetical protein
MFDEKTRVRKSREIISARGFFSKKKHECSKPTPENEKKTWLVLWSSDHNPHSKIA